MNKRYLVYTILFTLAMMPALSHAAARLVSVTAVSGGCVSGPSGATTQFWDVEQAETYTIRISHVLECANGGTDPTLNVRVNNTDFGNTDLVATNVAPGVYEFDFTLPVDAGCTFPINYCTTPGSNSTGIKVIRDDGVGNQAHLRASSFGAGCTNPTEILGPDCAPVPTEESTWGKIKALYR